MSDITDYNNRARQELRRRLKGKTPWNRQRDIRRLANLFRSDKSWCFEIPEAAAGWVAALDELKDEQPVNVRKGRLPGTTKEPEMPYTDRAYAKLIALAFRVGRRDWALELFKGGGKNRPSRGRALIAETARSLAEKDGIHLDSKKLAEQIRKRAKFWSAV